MNYPLLGSPEFFAACAEADLTITAGDGKKPIVRKPKPRKLVDTPRTYPPHVKARVIELKKLYPLKGKAEIALQVYRETKVYVDPSLVTQWIAAHRAARSKNVQQKT